MRRSNQLVLAGIAFFVVGVVIVLLLGRDSGGSASAATSGTTPVLFVTQDIPAGTKGEDAINKVEVKQVAVAEKQPDALTSPSQLSNERFVAQFTKGEQVRSGGLQARLASVELPAGKEALAVKFNNIAGGAGYIQGGDQVNVYSVIPASGAGGPNAPVVKLLLTNVRVLDVSAASSTLAAQTQAAATPTTAAVQQRTTPTDNLTLLLAVDTVDAEKVIFGSSIDANYLVVTKVGDAAPPAGPTPGQTYGSIYDETPNQAYARSSAGQ